MATVSPKSRAMAARSPRFVFRPGLVQLGMSHVKLQISMSLDGYVAGPKQSVENPLGEGGMRLLAWMIAADEDPPANAVDTRAYEQVFENIGAFVMGRKTFGGGDGPWDLGWTGRWGEDPPYHTPVFVLSHYPREPLPMAGGTEFRFVTGGLDAAIVQAREAAGDRDVSVAGGASTVRQSLAAGLLDEVQLHLVPVLMGSGEQTFTGLADVRPEQVEATVGANVTHIRYRVLRN
jgi:dihydrofolate reductase